MDYVITSAACAWMVLFLVLEQRRGGRAGYLLRALGSVPLLVLVVLAWTGRFSYDALMIGVVFVVVLSIVGLALDELGKRRSTERPG